MLSACNLRNLKNSKKSRNSKDALISKRFYSTILTRFHECLCVTDARSTHCISMNVAPAACCGGRAAALPALTSPTFTVPSSPSPLCSLSPPLLAKKQDLPLSGMAAQPDLSIRRLVEISESDALVMGWRGVGALLAPQRRLWPLSHH